MYPIGEPPMAQFAQNRFRSENATSYRHWFSTSHCSTMWRPADRGEVIALARPCEFSRCQTTSLEGHRVRDVVMLTSGNGTIALAKNGTEAIVRPGGRGELVEVIRFCGLLSGENIPVALAVAGRLYSQYCARSTENYLHLARLGMARKSAFTACSVRLPLRPPPNSQA